MKTYIIKKKAVLIVCIVLIILVAAAAAGYFGYGATLLNPNSDSSIKSVVSKECYGFEEGLGNREIEILAKKQYGDYFAVLFYALPADGQGTADAYFNVYKKHKAYANRYEICHSSGGSGSGDFEMATVCSLIDEDNPSTHVACFFANTPSSETACSVFEVDTDAFEHPYVRKLEEFTPPQDEPYIIVKEYDLTKAGNSITCQDGSFDLLDIYGEET